jgi:hypothetical protein
MPIRQRNIIKGRGLSLISLIAFAATDCILILLGSRNISNSECITHIKIRIGSFFHIRAGNCYSLEILIVVVVLGYPRTVTFYETLELGVYNFLCCVCRL